MLNLFDFDAEFLDSENIISKLNLLFRIERMDPYMYESTLQDRIQNSLSYLPKDYRKYALALYANTIYFPKAFSQSVLQHMLNSLMFRFGITWDKLHEECLLLEQDPTGIVNDFMRANHIHGRLDKEKFPRKQQIKEFVEMADDCLDNADFRGLKYSHVLLPGKNYNKAQKSSETVLKFLDRKYWVVLVDNSLSGTSLITDLERLVNLYERAYMPHRKIVVLVRTLTKSAERAIKEYFQDYFDSKLMMIESGLLLDERFVINDERGQRDKCTLFQNKGTYDGVVELCEWLVDRKVYKNDPLLADHKKCSVGAEDMTYGFKNCGLTFVSSENCPSDSLPLLWYSNEELYLSPFPRVLSRIGGKNNVR